MTTRQAADLAPATTPGPPAPGVPLPAPIAVLLVAVVSGIWAQGAFSGPSQRVMTLLVALAVIVALVDRPWTSSDTRLPVTLAGGGLAAWAVISAAANGRPASALSTVAVVAGIIGAIVVVRRTTAAQRRAVAGALLAIGALVALVGWAGVVWRLSPWALVDEGLWRAATTITYANASAALLVPLALVGLALLTTEEDRRSPWLLTGTSLALIGGGATLSRAGALALVAGLVVLAGLRGPRLLVGSAWPPLLGAALALAALTPSIADRSVGHPWLAVAGLMVGVCVAVVLPRARVRSGPLVVAGAVGLVVLVASFVAAIGSQRATGTRLSLSSPDRARETAAAVDLVRQRPLTGVGPGRATLRWTDDGGQVMVARFAHNEYLQAAAELGVVGLVMVAGLIAAIGLAVWRARPSACGDCPPELWAGVAAALVALLVHSGLDFVWHVTVLPLMGAVLAGLATSQPTKEQP